jgi:hypothetical protein
MLICDYFEFITYLPIGNVIYLLNRLGSRSNY